MAQVCPKQWTVGRPVARALRRSWLWMGLLLVLAVGPAGAQTNGPAVVFERDIQPIFEQSCLRCHGAVKPKSSFRLTDRASALRGGANYPDAIVPSNSAVSKLIQFVSGEPEDMQMPPADKGEPLTAPQIALLRKWIDEGANWGEPAKPEFAFSITPGARWIDVRGDDQKFRALEGIEPGWAGGLEHFSLNQGIDAHTKVSTEGHYLYDDHDGAFKLALERQDTGFLRFGLEQWRSYSDDTGGYYPAAAPAALSLDRDLYLDHGRAWVDLGLTLPDWPQLVFGYEYRYREGDEATLQWGQVGDRNIYPSPKHIDEELHILKFDLSYETGGWLIEDNARVEFYDLATSRDNAIEYTIGPRPALFDRVQESVSSVQGANAVRVEKQLYDWWLLAGGYLFSLYNGENRLSQNSLDENALPTNGQFWSTDDLTLRRHSQVVSAASLFQPAPGLSAALGAQGEWSRQEGAGEVHLDYGDPNLPESFTLQPASLSANLDRWRTSEHANLRFTQIPWTVVYGDARLDQERASQFESLIPEPEVLDLHDGFLRDTDFQNDQFDLHGGFTTSPWHWLSLGGSYRWRSSDSDYDHHRDYSVTNFSSRADNLGYSAFITAREIESDAIEARVVLRPLTWLHTALTYRRVKTDYQTTTEGILTNFAGGRLTAARHEADIYGANITVTPWQRLFLTTTFSYSDTRTVAADQDSLAVAPYAGDIYSVIMSIRFVVSERTDFFGSYGFSKSDYAQNTYADGLPLGMEFTRHSLTAGFSRRLSERCAVSLRYAYYDYAEPSAGGVNDYAAQGVFVSFNYRWQ